MFEGKVGAHEEPFAPCSAGKKDACGPAAHGRKPCGAVGEVVSCLFKEPLASVDKCLCLGGKAIEIDWGQPDNDVGLEKGLEDMLAVVL